MKQLIKTIKSKLIHLLFEQIELVSRTEVSQFDIDGDQFVPVKSPGKGIAILRKNMYVAFERRYKVISQKELKGIVENEMGYHSPFDNSYVLYRMTELGEGNWLVNYYFVDVDEHPYIKHYGMVLIWEQIVRFILGDRFKTPLKLRSAVGEQLIVVEENSLHVNDIHESNLKNRILLNEEASNIVLRDVSGKELTSKLVTYLLTFVWASLRGAINKKRFLDNRKELKLNPRQLGIVAALGLISIVIESAYLLGTNYYLDNKMQSSSELRDQYSTAKSQYLSNLDKYSALASIITAKSNAADIPKLLHQFEGKGDIRIDRMDYLQGEVRVGGISGNIEALMSYLSERPQVKGLEFVSPITPDKSGKDRFLIRFDLLND